METQINICGNCSSEFKSRGEYLDHICTVSGVTPKDKANLNVSIAIKSSTPIEEGMVVEEPSEVVIEQTSEELPVEETVVNLDI
jgi:hypothetical protein